MSGIANYTDDDIKTLSPREHIRLRPGMYIGKLGDGTAHDDGIYVLIKDCLLYTSCKPNLILKICGIPVLY